MNELKKNLRNIQSELQDALQRAALAASQEHQATQDSQQQVWWSMGRWLVWSCV